MKELPLHELVKKTDNLFSQGMITRLNHNTNTFTCKPWAA